MRCGADGADGTRRLARRVVILLLFMAAAVAGGWLVETPARADQLTVTVNANEMLGPVRLAGFMAANWANLNDQTYYGFIDSGLQVHRHVVRHDLVAITRIAGCTATDGSCLTFDFTAFDAHFAQFGAEFPMWEKGIVVILGVPRALSSAPDAPDGAFWAYAPAHLDEWYTYIHQMVARRVSQFGLAGAWYALWDEPDTAVMWRGAPGDTDTLASYLRLYAATATAIRAADPGAKVGGPAASHWDGKALGVAAWGVPEFLQALKQAGATTGERSPIPLDFIDWHDYAWKSPLITDGAAAVSAWADALALDPKPALVISAWNRGRGPNCAPFSSLEVASHAAHNLLRAASDVTAPLAQVYWSAFEMEPDCPNTALMVLPESGPAQPEYCLRPGYAVYQMLTEMKVGQRVRAEVPEPLAGLATRFGDDRVFLALNNHTAAPVTVAVNFANVPLEERVNLVTYRIDATHSHECAGIELGNKERVLLDNGAYQMALELPAYGTAQIIIANERQYW